MKMQFKSLLMFCCICQLSSCILAQKKLLLSSRNGRQCGYRHGDDKKWQMINLSTTCDQQGLTEAVKTRLTSVVKTLLRKCALSVENQRLSAMLAFKLGYFEILDLLLSGNKSNKTRVFFNDELNLLLARAVKKRRANTVAVLLKHGARDSTTPPQVLLYALRTLDRPTAMALLRHGNLSKAVLEYSDKESGDGAIFLAIETGRYFATVVREMLRIGVDPNTRKSTVPSSDTLLIATIKRLQAKSKEIVEILLRGGANVNDKDAGGETALHWACRLNLTATVRILLTSGASVQASSKTYATPLHIAANQGVSPEIVKLLIEKGAFIDAQTSVRRTPLIMAALYKAPLETFSLLLSHGADVNATDTGYDTALIIAATYNLLDICELLIEKGASVNARDMQNITALYQVASHGGSLELARLLIRHGAEVNVPLKPSGNTALIVAAAFNNVELVDLLLNRSANINARDANGNAPLGFAVSYSASFAIIENLLKHGADVNNLNFANDCPLTLAVEVGASYEIVELLLRYGADVNVTTVEGNSALSLAYQSNRTDLIDLLISYGAHLRTDKSNNQPAQFNQQQATSTLQFSNISNWEPVTVVNYPFKIIPSVDGKSSKPYKLSMLWLLDGFYRNSDPSSRKCLLDGIKLLLDTVNYRADILPGYSLEVHYFDTEVEAITMSPQLLDLFIQGMSSPLAANNTYSPVILGPNSPCEPLSELSSSTFQKVQKYFKMNSIYGSDCNGPTFYSAIERPIDPHDISALTAASFMKSQRFGFHWKQVGLFADSRDPLALASVHLFQNILAANDIRVMDIQIGDRYKDMFLAAKAKRVRIITFATAVRNCSLCNDVFCQSHEADIRPDKYVLLFSSSDCLFCISSEAKNNCEESIQRKQMAMSFFAVQQKEAAIVNVLVSLKAQLYIQPILDTIKRTVDFESACPGIAWKWISNSFLITVFLLNYTEQKLNNDYQTTLRQQLHPSTLVNQLISDAAAVGEFQNSKGGVWYDAVRVGNIIQLNFDPKIADKSLWLEGIERRVVAKIWPLTVNDTLNLNLTSHRIESGTKIIWANGKPPRDLSRVVEVNASFDGVAFHTVLGLTVFAALIQISMGLIALYQRSRVLLELKSIHFDYQNNLIILFGGILLIVSAFTLLLEPEFRSARICLLSRLFVVIGLTLINGTLLAKMWRLSMYIDLNRYISRKFRKPNIFDVDLHDQQRQIGVDRLQSKTTNMSCSVTIFVSFLTVVWLTSDPIELLTAVEHETDPVFDSYSDTFFTYRVEWCESDYQTRWISTFSAIQALLLVLATLRGAASKRLVKFVRRRWQAEIVYSRMAVSNAATIGIFIALLMIVVPAKPESLWYLKTLVFALGEIFYSISTTLVLFKPVWSLLTAKFMESSETIINSR